MVNPHVDDREYDSVCFFLTPKKIHLHVFQSSSIQFDSYALAADLASDARLQCSSVMRGCIDLPLCFGSFTVTVVTSYRGLTMVSPSLQPPYQGSDLESVPRFSGKLVCATFDIIFSIFLIMTLVKTE